MSVEPNPYESPLVEREERLSPREKRNRGWLFPVPLFLMVGTLAGAILTDRVLDVGGIGPATMLIPCAASLLGLLAGIAFVGLRH